MKKLASVIAFSLFICASSFAQDKTAVPQPAQPETEVRTIYEYKAELGLTDKQVGDLKKVLEDFQSYFADKKKALVALQTELGEMITKKEDIAKIRKQMENMARIQVDASCFDIETSRKIESVLSPKQMAMWKAIQSDFQSKAQERMKEARGPQKAVGAKQ